MDAPPERRGHQDAMPPGHERRVQTLATRRRLAPLVGLVLLALLVLGAFRQRRRLRLALGVLIFLRKLRSV